MSLNERFGELVEEQLRKIGSRSKTKIYDALSKVLPFSAYTIGRDIIAYSQGRIRGSTAFTRHGGCLTSEQARERRSQILYALGVEDNSNLITVLRELDPQTKYPPEVRSKQISSEQIRGQATLYQKINALSGPRRDQVGELVDTLYKAQMRE